MSEIKGCPANDNHTPVTFWKRDVGGKAYRIECGYCGCTVTMPTRESAIAAWNARAPQEPQWQPIETAPRDNKKRVLLASAGKWAGEGFWYDFDQVWHNDLTFMREDGDGITPTHWMPLPAPPEVEE